MPNCFGDRGHSRSIGRTYDDLVSDAVLAQITGWEGSARDEGAPACVSAGRGLLHLG
jgi:hypothetical protein